MHRILITGGAGFIGSHLVEYLLSSDSPLEIESLVVVDKLTYAGSLLNLEHLGNDSRLLFYEADINDNFQIKELLAKHEIDTLYHLAAETHVDRSIDGASPFVQTNVVGTVALLDEALLHWQRADRLRYPFRFIHVSTDEVFGALTPEDHPFTAASPWAPNSPYAASKTSSDAFVRAWHQTWGLPTIVANASNNYGSRQFPEKLIPLAIRKTLKGESVPLYGDGEQRRDWLHVKDHVAALAILRLEGVPGNTYLFGSGNDVSNVDLLHALGEAIRLSSYRRGHSYELEFSHVSDRPGHDRRYAIDLTATFERLSWRPKKDLQTGLQETVDWYFQHQEWVDRMLERAQYRTERLGLPKH